MLLWIPERENPTAYQEDGLVLRHRPLPYWLDYLRTFAGVHSPVLLIQSQCDTPAKRIRSLPVSIDGFRALEYLQVSAKTGLGLDLVKASLKEAVRDCVAHRPLPPIGKGRVRVRNRLRQLLSADQNLPASQRRYRWLNREEFDRLCREAGGVSDSEALLEFLHYRGVIFYRAKLFDGRIILDQDWALEAIYALFDRKKSLPILRNYGRFNRADLETLIWSSYTHEEQNGFLDMMESCGICFRVRKLADNEWEYMAPELLPVWTEAQKYLLAGRLLQIPPAVQAEARYPSLHEGVLRHYLSRIGRQAGDAAVYWRYGCWFYEATTDGRVLIEGLWDDSATETGAGIIRFRAWGERARQLLESLLRELHKLPIGQIPQVTWQITGLAIGPGSDSSNRQETSQGNLQDLVITESVQPVSGSPRVFISYAWGDDSSEIGRKWEQVVEDLCANLRTAGWEVVRDKTVMRFGDLISTFMKTISHADLIIIIFSGKYLRSLYCMTELYGIYRRSNSAKEFLQRIIPLTLNDAKIGTWRDRARIAQHWKTEFEELEKSLCHLGPEDFKLYKSMQDWHNHIGEVLAHVSNVLSPRGFEAIVMNDFAALKKMLQSKQASECDLWVSAPS